MEPRYSNWEEYVYNLATVRPISYPPFQIQQQMLKIQRHMPEAKSEAPPIFNPDDMFKTPSIQDAVSEPQRPASPMTGV